VLTNNQCPIAQSETLAGIVGNRHIKGGVADRYVDEAEITQTRR
jgi:hypothetical protein